MLQSRVWRPALLTTLVVSCATGTPDEDANVTVIEPDVYDVSPPLRELAKLPVPERTELRAREASPVRAIPHMRLQPAVQRPDPVVQNAIGGPNIPTPVVSFEGMGSGLAGFGVQSVPPDTDGDIGPNHYVQIVNSSTTIFNRQGGRVLGPVLTSTFFAGLTPCGSTNDGDGVVRYDRYADRWIIAQLSFNGSSGPSFQCVAVSTSPDPTSSYFRYQFSYTALISYPKMALWPGPGGVGGSYVTTYNIFPPPIFNFGGAKACAFDRAKMLAGQAATQICFDTTVDIGGLLASDVDGPTLPPADSYHYLLALDPNRLAFFKMKVDFADPAKSKFVGPTFIPTAAFTPLCNGGTCVTQPGTANRLDSLADRLMNRLVYRNFGDHEALLVSHAVAAGTGGGVRFYELRNPATTPTIFQQGTFAPDSAFRWMSSMAFDGSGNIGMGYSISSSALNIRPSIRYTGRLTTDALGTMGQGEATIVAGGGSQINNLTRWGDYSSLNIDPTDDCTFWYTGEYMGANGSFNWRTRVGAFRFAACGQASNDFSITPNPTSQTVNAGASTIYEINTAVLSGTAQTINLSVSKLPAGVTGTFKPASVTAGTSSTLTLAVAPATSVGTTQFTITGTDTLLTTHTTTASVTVIPNEPPTVTITSPINGSTVSGTVAVSVNASDTDGMVASVRFDLPDGASVSASAPFSITWNSKTVPNGNYEITATAIDNLGATSESTVTVTVANSDFSITPDPTLQTITAGARTTYTINTAVLSGIAQTIELSVSGLPAGVTGSFNPASVTAGSSSTLTLTSSATTAAGTTQFTITGTATAAKHTTNASVTVTPNEPPTVTVTSPTSGSVVSGTVTVSASASDSDGIASVKFDLPDGTSVFDTLAPFSTTWDSTSVPEGSGYLIHATASDNRGVVSVATVTIAVNNCVNNTFSAEDVPIAIPDNEISGITSSIPVTGNGTVASLLLSLDITHTFRGDLVVNLISPDSAVFSVSNRDGDSNDDIIFTNLAVSTFNGEPAAGTWQLSVQDRSPGSTGTLNSWSLAIVGTCPQITHWASTATPNLPTIDNGTACTNLTVSTGGSSSGAKLDIFGRHDFRSTLGGTLAHNGATVAAFPTGTFPSGGGTFSFTNRSAPGLSGDASGTWTLCIIDTDGLGDTGVLTAWSVHD